MSRFLSKLFKIPSWGEEGKKNPKSSSDTRDTSYTDFFSCFFNLE